MTELDGTELYVCEGDPFSMKRRQRQSCFAIVIYLNIQIRSVQISDGQEDRTYSRCEEFPLLHPIRYERLIRRRQRVYTKFRGFKGFVNDKEIFSISSGKKNLYLYYQRKEISDLENTCELRSQDQRSQLHGCCYSETDDIADERVFI